ncbi:beta strand repeat-containing protein, partial [Nanoarchaeota archaeon]
SSTTFVDSFNWTINKSVFSPTFIIAKQTVEKILGSGSSELAYYFENLDNGQVSPYWTRYLKDVGDSGSASGIFIETEELATRQESIASRTDAGEINVKLKSFNFDLRDFGGNLVSNFHASNPNTNINNSVLYGPGGTHLILNKTVTIQNGTSYFIGMSTSALSNTGDQTVTYFINVTGASCYSKKERSIQSGNDVGNVFIYHICEDLVVGNNYTINLWVQLNSNNEIYQLDESLNGFEVTGFNISEGELPPLPNSITDPLNGTYQGGYKNVTWLAFSDKNFDPVVYTVTLRDLNYTIISTLAVNISQLYTPINYSEYPSDEYIIVVEGCDDTGLCANSTSNFFLDSQPPSFNTIYPTPGTQFNQTNIVPVLASVDENSTVTANITYPDSTSTIVNLLYNGTDWYYNTTFTDTLIPGQYNVTYYASDIAGNSNTTTSYFIVNDITNPSVTVVEPTVGSSYVQNTIINISASVTDAYYNNINSVIANVTWDSTYQEVTLTYNAGTGLYENTFNNTSLVDQYNITIIATDNANNINNTETSYFTIYDVTSPTFINISPQGETYNQTDTVSLSASLNENSTVSANITYPDGTSTIINLIYNGTEWYYNTTFTDTLIPGQYNITFNATDNSNNSNIISDYFIVEDITNPSVEIISPSLGTNYTQTATVPISVNITDPYYNNINSVIANVTWDATYQEVVLTYNASTGLYESTFSNTSDIDQYNITIIATDNANNINSTETSYFTILDSTVPIFLQTEPQGGTYNQTDTVPLSVSMDENTTVTANLTYPNGTSIIINLTYNGTDWNYNTTFTDTLIPGQYNITFNATDELSNSNSVSDYFIVEDTTNPSVEVISPNAGNNYFLTDTVPISANVTDAYYNNINSVIANVTWNSTYEEVTLTYNAGTGLYENTFNNTSDVGQYNITIIATDNANNINNTETTWFNILYIDLIDPVIIDTLIDPYDPALNYNVTLDMNATDNEALGGKFANITLPDGTTITLPLGTDYTITQPGRHNVTFFANDTAGNIATYEDYFIAGSVLVNVQFNAVDNNFTGIPVNLTIYFTGTNKDIHLHQFTGIKIENHTNIYYDLDYQALSNNVNVKLNQVNLSLNNNNTLGLDRITNMHGFLIIYGIYSDYNFSNAQVTVSYAGTNYTDEDKLGFYTCSDWNFTARTCNINWTLYTGTQDKNNDLFTFTTTSFSAFAVKQETTVIPPTPPSSSGGGGGGGAGPRPSTNISITDVSEPSSVSRPLCGNNICEPGESSANCCLDCSCSNGFICYKNLCEKETAELIEVPKIVTLDRLYFLNPWVLDEEMEETILNYEILNLYYGWKNESKTHQTPSSFIRIKPL